ncbi:endonuclease/exonuclease/phosphatase family protein [Sphingobacterium daejeonense]|uniref:endonuclease/exonuclease/phosphatase family protein n=1 Tax=Sphingobacterium daejeonense TaxID=371142 RepID=UPI0010C3582C|nr:endonuclease/exonuclease/phosphatase family protein [Sphingobacterium daejeonense]VTP92570.1 Sphingomyelinase C precursor [Sphingobacterium daejeonense]
MLINLPYPQKSKAWHFRFLMLLSVFFSLIFLFSYKKSNGSKANLFVEHPALEDRSSGELSLLTYNIAGLPAIISSAETPRASSIREIGERINRFDIVNVQEDFNYNAELYSFNLHPYRTQTMGTVPFGDGLSTLSKFPIMESQRIAWSDCSGSDCFTPKGFSYTRIQIAKDVFLDVYNIHATAQDNKNAVAARKKNLKQLAAFIHENSECQPLLIMGDFNAHYAFVEDNVRDFQKEIHVFDSWTLLRNKGLVPEHQEDFVASHALNVTDDCESIDKIYFRNSDQIIFTPKNYQVQHDLFSTDSGQPLSDHCAISLNLEWELTNSSQDTSVVKDELLLK